MVDPNGVLVPALKCQVSSWFIAKLARMNGAYIHACDILDLTS